MSLKLKIVSPERVEFNGEAEVVKVPGLMGMFEILSNHAPIIWHFNKVSLNSKPVKDEKSCL